MGNLWPGMPESIPIRYVKNNQQGATCSMIYLFIKCFYNIHTHYIFISKECITVSGPSKNVSCIFPFTYNHVTYHECILDLDGAWCSTEVDDDGMHVGGQGKWGICGAECPIPPSGISSRMYIFLPYT